MTDDGDTKDDVKMPDGEIGDKITKLFKEEEKDTSKSLARTSVTIEHVLIRSSSQTSLFSPPWASRPPWRPRRLPAKIKI